MSKTVELGRAVLHSPEAQLQLWLTTLITISPQQEGTNLTLLSQSSLLDLLTSRDVWVCRGAGLHMKLALTEQGERLGRSQTQQIAHRILDAPIWKQLYLLPSLPVDGTDYVGEIKLNIQHAPEDAFPLPTRRHRILADMPFRDVQPPDDVPVIHLQSVNFSMEIMNMEHGRGRGSPKRRKQTNCQVEASFKMKVSQIESEMLFENEKFDYRPPAPEIVRKETSPCRGKGRRLSAAGSRKRTVETDGDGPENVREISKLVDASLRLSIGPNLSSRTMSGLSLRANTFSRTLSTVCPALWRPEYLPALAQRARMVSTVGRSISRAATKGKSGFLREKMSELATLSTGPMSLVGLPAIFSYNSQSSHRSAEVRLWRRLQSDLLAAKPEQLRECCVCVANGSSNPKVEEQAALFDDQEAHRYAEQDESRDPLYDSYIPQNSQGQFRMTYAKSTEQTENPLQPSRSGLPVHVPSPPRTTRFASRAPQEKRNEELNSQVLAGQTCRKPNRGSSEALLREKVSRGFVPPIIAPDSDVENTLISYDDGCSDANNDLVDWLPWAIEDEDHIC